MILLQKCITVDFNMEIYSKCLYYKNILIMVLLYKISRVRKFYKLRYCVCNVNALVIISLYKYIVNDCTTEMH